MTAEKIQKVICDVAELLNGHDYSTEYILMKVLDVCRMFGIPFRLENTVAGKWFVAIEGQNTVNHTGPVGAIRGSVGMLVTALQNRLVELLAEGE